MEENVTVNTVNGVAVDTFQVRMNLVLEQREDLMDKGRDASGVRLRRWHHQKSGLRPTEVRILNEQGVKSVRRLRNARLTLEADRLSKADDDYHSEMPEELTHQIYRLMAEMTGYREEDLPSALVVGLGSSPITPDPLSPWVLGSLQVARHLDGQYGNTFLKDRKLPAISGIASRVMAQTDMETTGILKGIIHETHPDLIIAIDALVIRNARCLGIAIRPTDIGVHPGSGAGSHRHSLTKESLGMPMTATGVPTVVGTTTIVHDTVSALVGVLTESEGAEGTES